MSDRASETVDAYLDAHEERMVDDLLAFLRIPSVSTDPAHRSDVEAAAARVARRMRQAGITNAEVKQTAGHPVVYAAWLRAPEAPTATR